MTPRLPSPSALGVTSPRPAFRSPPSSRQNSFRSRAETADSQPELDKYTEKDDEDYSDIFDKQSTLGKPELSMIWDLALLMLTQARRCHIRSS